MPLPLHQRGVAMGLILSKCPAGSQCPQFQADSVSASQAVILGLRGQCPGKVDLQVWGGGREIQSRACECQRKVMGGEITGSIHSSLSLVTWSGQSRVLSTCIQITLGLHGQTLPSCRVNLQRWKGFLLATRPDVGRGQVGQESRGYGPHTAPGVRAGGVAKQRRQLLWHRRRTFAGQAGGGPNSGETNFKHRFPVSKELIVEPLLGIRDLPESFLKRMKVNILTCVVLFFVFVFVILLALSSLKRASGLCCPEVGDCLQNTKRIRS